MPDFHFNIVPTFPLLVGEDTRSMEKKIMQARKKIPAGVLIPALFRDLSSDAMKHIIEVLSGTEYLKRIYVALDKATEEEYFQAKKE